MSQTQRDPSEAKSAHRAGAFDIRTFIAVLIGIYGIVLIIMGFTSDSASDLKRSGNLNVNLWAGIGMVVVAAVFQAWAMWRPVVVSDHADGPEDQEEPPTSR